MLDARNISSQRSSVVYMEIDDDSQKQYATTKTRKLSTKKATHTSTNDLMDEFDTHKTTGIVSRKCSAQTQTVETKKLSRKRKKSLTNVDVDVGWGRGVIER